jgi:hypothetical protein
MIIEINIPRSSPVISHKLLISLRSFILRVPRQHALQAHAYAALLAEQVKTDDAVRVDVWVHGYWSVGAEEEGYFWGL